MSGLRPAQLEALENGFNDIDGIDPAARKSTSPNKEAATTIVTNINPKGAVGGGKISKPTS